MLKLTVVPVIPLALPVPGAARWEKTLAPSRAKARATAPPIPPPAPYITATLFSNIISGFFLKGSGVILIFHSFIHLLHSHEYVSDLTRV
jgi:hypothetical protein